MTAALIAVFAFLVLIIGGMFLVAWLDDRLCAMRDASDPDKETPPKGWCQCGDDTRIGVHWNKDHGTACHRYYVRDELADPRTAPTDVIPADPDRRKTQRGSWGRA